MGSIGTASLDTAGAPDDLFFPPRRGVVCQERLHGKRSEQEFVARRWRAILRAAGAECWRLLGVVELPGTRRTTQTPSRNRNLQPRGLLAQSRRRICFIPGDEGIVVPVCVADTLGGLEPGGAAQLPKAVVHLHNSGHQRLPLISSIAQILRATGRILRHSSSAATHG